MLQNIWLLLRPGAAKNIAQNFDHYFKMMSYRLFEKTNYQLISIGYLLGFMAFIRNLIKKIRKIKV